MTVRPILSPRFTPFFLSSPQTPKFPHSANLMANITKLQPPSRLVTDLADLPKLGLPACVLNRTSHLTFMAKRFPDVAVKVIESPTVGGLLRALGEVRGFSGLPPGPFLCLCAVALGHPR